MHFNINNNSQNKHYTCLQYPTHVLPYSIANAGTLQLLGNGTQLFSI